MNDKERDFDQQLIEQARIRKEMEEKLDMLRNAKVGGNKGQRPVVSEADRQQYEEMKQEFEIQHQQEQDFKRQETKDDSKNNREVINDNFEEMSEKFIKLQQQ